MERKKDELPRAENAGNRSGRGEPAQVEVKWNPCAKLNGPLSEQSLPSLETSGPTAPRSPRFN
jgi:hypothetical protein